MNKKNASVFLALFLNVLFSALFLGGFYLLKENESATVFMNQIGIYADELNARESEQRVNSLGLSAYTYTIDDLYVVVTSVYEDENETRKEAQLLVQNEIACIEKQVSSADSSFLAALKAKDVKKMMELMKN